MMINLLEQNFQNKIYFNQNAMIAMMLTLANANV